MNPADQPILFLALTSTTLPLSTVDEYAETLMAQRISMVNGVAQVQVFGSQKYRGARAAGPAHAGRRAASASTKWRAAIASGNVNLPTGTLYGQHQAFTVQANGQLTNAAAYRPLIVAYRNGAPVRLEELGNVIDSVENDKVAAWLQRTRASIMLAIQRQPGTNTVEVVDNIKQLLPHVPRADSAVGATWTSLYDRSRVASASPSTT